VFLEEGVEVISFGGSVQKRVLSGFGVEKAAHGIEFSEIESENFHRRCSLGLGLEFVTRCVASATHDHGFESPDFIR
jgi:hypothetical protein